MKKKIKKSIKFSRVVFYIIWFSAAAIFVNYINHVVFSKRITTTFLISDKTEETICLDNCSIESYKLTVRLPNSEKDLYNVPVKHAVYNSVDIGDSALFGIIKKGLDGKMSSIVFLKKS